jgi:proline iminopeptidase
MPIWSTSVNVPVIAERLMHSNLPINDMVFNDMQPIHVDRSAGLLSLGPPVLIIQCREDIVDEKIARLAHEVLKKSRVVLLDHWAHYGWLDARVEYRFAVKGFLAANSSRAPV